MEPADWVPGHVPCPTIQEHFEIEWSDPAVVIAGSRIRIWARSRELGVHKQIISVQVLDEELQQAFFVRVAQGAHIPPSSFPGHYLLQADVIQPNGLKSPPSRTVEVTVP
ncbi:hypothetical protein ES708_34450 [subsurface metagenome]